VNVKLNFQHHYHYITQSSAVSHDPSKIIIICWFGDQKTFVENILVETVIQESLKFRRTASFDIFLKCRNLL